MLVPFLWRGFLVALCCNSFACKESNGSNQDYGVPERGNPKGFEHIDTAKRIRPAVVKPSEEGKTNLVQEFYNDKSIEELGQKIPNFPPSVIIKKLSAPDRSRIANLRLCLRLPPQKAIVQLQEGFEAKKWSDWKASPTAEDANRFTLSARLGTFRLNGNLTQEKTEDCQTKRGYSLVTMTFLLRGNVIDGKNRAEAGDKTTKNNTDKKIPLGKAHKPKKDALNTKLAPAALLKAKEQPTASAKAK